MTATGKDKHMKFRVYVFIQQIVQTCTQSKHFKYDETACSIMMLIVILFQNILI